MPILPSLALFVILHCWPLVLHLVSAVWYERQRSRYANHWLLQLEQVADLFGPKFICSLQPIFLLYIFNCHHMLD